MLKKSWTDIFNQDFYKMMFGKSQKNCQKGIFLLNEGLPPTIFESQVLTHVNAMIKQGIPMEVWAFAPAKQAYDQGLRVLPRLLKEHHVKIKLLRFIRPALPFSHRINGLILYYWLLRYNCQPKFIHARTEYSAAVAASIKRWINFKLIWDARGDTLSEFEDAVSTMALPYKWLAVIKSMDIRCRLNIAARNCDKAIFVSEALRELQGKSLDAKKTIIIPCLADEGIFYYDSSVRRRMRAQLGYNHENIVIVYSGSTGSWQCVNETIELMSQMIQIDSRCRALIITPEPEVFQKLIPKQLISYFKIIMGTLLEMNGYLNAADIGVMIRKNNPINRVASPVKFAEYSLTGLQVITTDAVDQTYTWGKEIGNIIDNKNIEILLKDINIMEDDRLNRANNAYKYFSRDFHLKTIIDIYK